MLHRQPLLEVATTRKFYLYAGYRILKPEQELWGFPVSNPTPYVTNTTHSSLGMGSFVFNLSKPLSLTFLAMEQILEHL